MHHIGGVMYPCGFQGAPQPFSLTSSCVQFTLIVIPWPGRRKPWALYRDLSVKGAASQGDGEVSTSVASWGKPGHFSVCQRHNWLISRLPPIECRQGYHFLKLPYSKDSRPGTPVQLTPIYKPWQIWQYGPRIQENFDQCAVSEVQNLVRLRIFSAGSIGRLSRTFPELEYLHLDEVKLIQSLLAFSAPRLKTLSLAFVSWPESYGRVCQCPGIPFQALKELVIDLSLPLESLIPKHCSRLRMVLDVATNIKVLHVANEWTLDIIIDFLWDLSVCQYHNFSLKYFDRSMKIGRGESRAAKLAAFRAQIKPQKK